MVCSRLIVGLIRMARWGWRWHRHAWSVNPGYRMAWLIALQYAAAIHGGTPFGDVLRLVIELLFGPTAH